VHMRYWLYTIDRDAFCVKKEMFASRYYWWWY